MFRKQLPENTIIYQADGITITVVSFFAYGGSALVYKGLEENAKGKRHILIKEIYPDGRLTRDENNTIYGKIAQLHQKYLEHVDRTKNEVEHYNQLVSGESEARNDAYFCSSWFIPPEQSLTHNCYVILDTVKGNTLDKYIVSKNCSFYECCVLMEKLLVSVMVLHNELEQMEIAKELPRIAGHLDISPDNIYVSESIETVRLLDFNSSAYFFSDNELKMPSKYKYTAPELYRGDYEAISYRADFYSLSVVFFGMLTGHVEYEKGKIHKQLTSSLMCKNIHPGAIRTAAECIEKGLEYDPEMRWNTAEDMLKAVSEVRRLSEIRVFLRDNCSHVEIPQYCYMRDDVLETIHNKLLSDRHIFVSGIGGSGKSTLSVMYALKYRHLYDSIQFVTYSTNLKDLITALSFNGISEEDFKNSDGKIDTERMYAAILNALNAPENAKNLIIIENYNILPDEQYAEFMSNINCCVIFNTRCYKENDSAYLKLNDLEEEDAYSFFQSICQRSDEEKEIRQIIDCTGKNFLLMKLIALLLVNSDELSAEELLNDLNNNQEYNQAEVSIDKTKDGIYYDKEVKIETHLLAVFDISKLTDELCEILSAMTVVPYSGIPKKDFETCLKLNKYDSRIRKLISLGWITKNGDTISLHQTISDLLFRNERTKPNWENLNVLLKFMAVKLFSNDKISILEYINFYTKKLYIQQTKLVCDSVRDIFHSICRAYQKFNHYYYAQMYYIMFLDFLIPSSSIDQLRNEYEEIMDFFEMYGAKLKKFANMIEEQEKRGITLIYGEEIVSCISLINEEIIYRPSVRDKLGSEFLGKYEQLCDSTMICDEDIISFYLDNLSSKFLYELAIEKYTEAIKYYAISQEKLYSPLSSFYLMTNPLNVTVAKLFMVINSSETIELIKYHGIQHFLTNIIKINSFPDEVIDSLSALMRNECTNNQKDMYRFATLQIKYRRICEVVRNMYSILNDYEQQAEYDRILKVLSMTLGY